MESEMESEMEREHWDAGQAALYSRNNTLQQQAVLDNWPRLGSLEGKNVLDIGCGRLQIFKWTQWSHALE